MIDGWSNNIHRIGGINQLIDRRKSFQLKLILYCLTIFFIWVKKISICRKLI